MKDFIYFDTDKINSYIAQYHDGLPTSTGIESTTDHEEGDLEHRSIDTNKSIEATLKFIKGSLSKDGTYIDKTIMDTDSVKEIVSKVMNDNLYNMLISDLDKAGLLKDSLNLNPNIGEFIHVIGKVELIDLDVFSDELLDYMEYNDQNEKQNTIKELKEDLKNLKETSKKISQGTPVERQEIASKIKYCEEQIKNLEKEDTFDKKAIKLPIDMLKKLLPSDIIFKHKNFIIFAEKKHLRQSSQGILLKYSDNLHLVGRVTRKGLSLDDQKDNPIENINSGVFDFNKTILPIVISVIELMGLSIDDDTYLVTPIAIYFS